MKIFIVSSKTHYDNYIEIFSELEHLEWYFVYRKPYLVRVCFRLRGIDPFDDGDSFDWKLVKRILTKHGINCTRRSFKRTFNVVAESDFVLRLRFSTQEIVELQ